MDCRGQKTEDRGRNNNGFVPLDQMSELRDMVDKLILVVPSMDQDDIDFLDGLNHTRGNFTKAAALRLRKLYAASLVNSES